jgi:hypothetical protein
VSECTLIEDVDSYSNVPDPDPNPDPDPPDPNPDRPDPRFFCLPDPNPDPLVRGMDPDPALDPDSDPSIIIIMQK